MSLNLLNPDPLPNSMTEIEEKGYSSQVETILAAHTVRDTVPETTPRTTNEAGTNLVIQENVIQHSSEMTNSMTEVEEEGYSSQVETILAAEYVGDTIPETTSRTTSGPGSNLVIQENVIQHSSEISSYTNQGPCRTSLTIRQARQKNID